MSTQLRGDGTTIADVHPVAKALKVIVISSDGHEGIHSDPVPITTGAVDAVGEFVLPVFNASNYKFVSLQLQGTWVATVTFEGSNDNATFYSIATTDPSGAGTGQTTATENGIVIIPTSVTYVRARISGYTSGTITSTAVAYKDENSSGLISTIGAVTVADGPVESIHKVITAATTNAAVIKSSAGRIRTFALVGGTTTVRFVHLYDKATLPTVGTDVPFVTITIPPNAESGLRLPQGGLIFSNGIGFSMTMGAADNNSAPDTVVAAVTGFIGFT